MSPKPKRLNAGQLIALLENEYRFDCVTALGGVPSGISENDTDLMAFQVRAVGLGYGNNRVVYDLIDQLGYVQNESPRKSIFCIDMDGNLHAVTGVRKALKRDEEAGWPGIVEFETVPVPGKTLPNMQHPAFTQRQ